ncbi:MAG: hypothetical protein LIQ30_07730 [Planctomycetes bacterium]|nr:hypothetical protein [Planctomycetota bacterium]MCC8115925.1 hypothetical protein [Planctomycetota bacterium]
MSRPLGIVNLPFGDGIPGAEPRHLETLRRDASAWEWREVTEKEAFRALLPDADVALVWRFPRSLADQAGKLRLLSTPSTGHDWIQMPDRPGLTVTYGTFHGELMAESVVGAMLAFTRGIKDAIDRKNEAWPRAEIAAGMRPIRGSRAVILGFGHVGKWIGRLLKPFGVGVTGVNRSNLERPEYFEATDTVVDMTGLDDALARADHVISVLPGSSDTDRVLDERRLGLLGKNAFLYNVGRGNAVDLDALASLLHGGRIAGAFLDVFPVEPLPDDAPIRKCPNLILAPHITAFGPNYIDLYIGEVIEHLRKLGPA